MNMLRYIESRLARKSCSNEQVNWLSNPGKHVDLAHDDNAALTCEPTVNYSWMQMRLMKCK